MDIGTFLIVSTTAVYRYDMSASDGVCFLSAEGLVGGVVRDIPAPSANYNARFYRSSSKCRLVNLVSFPPRLYITGCRKHVVVSSQPRCS